jgi:hypothetical protein
MASKTRVALKDRFSRSLGVGLAFQPYAPGYVDVDGRLIKVCPVCTKWFVEQTDEWGEPTTSTYANHYMRNHDPFMTTKQVEKIVAKFMRDWAKDNS